MMTEILNGSPSMNSQALQTALELSMLNISSTNLASLDSSCSFFEDGENSRSSNITQCVAVPSSEHVAEIVGRQGCKIKALRAKTNTYIKTPVRGEDPVFAISGRPELVNSAKWEIIAAAEHFSQIRAARSSSPNNFGSSENKVTIHVRVPYRVVGLVVGPKGATVKRIQQLTQTYIVTPSRDKEPCFEVKGTPENVQLARKEIESYIALRTGNNSIEEDSTFYNDNPFSPSNDPFSPNQSSTQMLTQQMNQCQLSDSPTFQFPGHASSLTNHSSQREVLGSQDGAGRNQWKPPPTVFSGLRFTPPSNTYQPTSAPLLMPGKFFDFNSTSNKPQSSSPTGSYESNSSDGLAATSPKQFTRLLKRGLKSCIVCKADNEVAAALVPCGHNMFCQTCVSCTHGSCPVCSAQVTGVVRM